MTAPYLPKVASLEQAQAWLEHETGQQWPLARLIEQTGIMPWVWLDYSPEHAEAFAGRLEGYLAPMLFAGDTQRLAAGADDVVITITEAADGRFMQLTGMRCPLAALRFKADDIRANAAGKPEVEAAKTQTSGPQVTKQELIDGLHLHDPKWEGILKNPSREGIRYKAALVAKGRRGKAPGGGTNSGLWNPVVFARLAIENGDLNKSAVTARFNKAWPNWQDELAAEMG